MWVHLATPDDADAIRTIYNAEILGSTATTDMVPRDIRTQALWMEAHAGAHPVVVAEDPEGVVTGFASLSPYRDRPGYSTTVEDSLYVHQDHRGQGVGRMLLNEVLRLAEVRGFHAVMARVIGGHDVSVALHTSCGFSPVGVEREVARKFGRWLDVILLQRMVQHPPPAGNVGPA